MVAPWVAGAPQPATRRQRRKATTARAIVDGAFTLFAVAGYEGVTVEQIADAADVSARTVYRYFPSKAAIVFDVQASWMTVFRDATAASVGEEPVLGQLRRIALAVAAHVAQHAAPALLSYRLTESSQELQAVSLGWEREWRTAVAAVARSWDRPRAVALAGAVMGMISAVLELWLAGGGEADLTAMIDRGFGDLEAGWRTD